MITSSYKTHTISALELEEGDRVVFTSSKTAVKVWRIHHYPEYGTVSLYFKKSQFNQLCSLEKRFDVLG